MAVCFAFVYHIHDFLRAWHKPLGAPLQDSQSKSVTEKPKSNKTLEQLNILPLLELQMQKGYSVDPKTLIPCQGLKFSIQKKSEKHWETQK